MTGFDQLVIVCLATGYFFPTWIGAMRGVRGLGMLFMGNLFFGWTVFGWVCLLFLAITGTVPTPEELARRD